MSKDLSGTSRDPPMGRSETRNRVTDRSTGLDEYIEEDDFHSHSHAQRDTPTYFVPQDTDQGQNQIDRKGNRFQTTGGRNLLHNDYISQSTSATVHTASRHTWEQISTGGQVFQLQPVPDATSHHRRRESVTLLRPLPTPRASSSEMSTTHSRSFYPAPSPRPPSRSDFTQQINRETAYEPRRMGTTSYGGVYTSPSVRSNTQLPIPDLYYRTSQRISPTIQHQQPQSIAGPSSARMGQGATGQRDMPIVMRGSTQGDDRLTVQRSTQGSHSNDQSRRSLSTSPLVSTRQPAVIVPDSTPRSQNRDLPGSNSRGRRQTGRSDRDERSLSPVRAHGTSQPIVSGAHASVAHTAEYNRPPGGAVASFFSLPPSRSAQKPSNAIDGVPESPLPTGIRTTSYPGNPPANVAPRSTSPARSQHSARPWFALGTPPNARDLSSWSIEHVRSYDSGFEDAIRAVEHGTIGIGSNQYRRPTLVRKEVTDGGVTSHVSSSLRGEERWRPPTRALHTPISSQSFHQTPLPPQPYQSRLSPRAYHNAALLPPNPQLVSPYDYHYPSQAHSHPSYPGGPRSDGYNDPYRYHHPHQSMFYPNIHSHALGLGPQRSQRQLISCFPCRARKLKCDGQKPCAQCVRRGTGVDCAYATHVRRRGKGKKSGGSGSSEEPISPSGEGMERGNSSASGTSSIGGGQVEIGRSAPISPLVDGSPFDGPPFSTTDGFSDDLQDGSSPTGELRGVKEEAITCDIQMDAVDCSSQLEVESEPEAPVKISQRSSDQPKLPFGGPSFYASMGLGRIKEKDQ